MSGFLDFIASVGKDTSLKNELGQAHSFGDMRARGKHPEMEFAMITKLGAASEVTQAFNPPGNQFDPQPIGQKLVQFARQL